MGSDFDEIFAPKYRHGYVKACGHLEVLYGDLWAYLCQVCLSMHFCDGHGCVWTTGMDHLHVSPKEFN